MQRTGYSIQHTTKKKEKQVLKKGKCSKSVKSMGEKYGIRDAENMVENLVEELV